MSKRTYIGIYIRVVLDIKDIEHDSKQCPNGHVIPYGMARGYCGDCGVELVGCKVPDTELITTQDLHEDDKISNEDENKLIIVQYHDDDNIEYLIVKDGDGFYLDQCNSSVALDHSVVNGPQLIHATKAMHADLFDKLMPLYKEFKVVYGVLQYYD